MVVYHFADIQAKSEAFENQSCRRVRGKLVLAWLFANLQLPVCYFIHHIIFLTFSVQFSMIFLLFCWQKRNSLAGGWEESWCLPGFLQIYSCGTFGWLVGWPVFGFYKCNKWLTRPSGQQQAKVKFDVRSGLKVGKKELLVGGQFQNGSFWESATKVKGSRGWLGKIGSWMELGQGYLGASLAVQPLRHEKEKGLREISRQGWEQDCEWKGDSDMVISVEAMWDGDICEWADLHGLDRGWGFGIPKCWAGPSGSTISIPELLVAGQFQKGQTCKDGGVRFGDPQVLKKRGQFWSGFRIGCGMMWGSQINIRPFGWDGD